MKPADVPMGCDVKNRQSKAWGRVVKHDIDTVTGHLVRVGVKPMLGPGHYASEWRWWLASNISMTERP
jgi:hypothetical protein